jgi:hypothetical protein
VIDRQWERVDQHFDRMMTAEPVAESRWLTAAGWLLERIEWIELVEFAFIAGGLGAAFARWLRVW